MTQLVIQSVGPYLGGDGKLDSSSAADEEKYSQASPEAKDGKTITETEEKAVRTKVVKEEAMEDKNGDSLDKDAPVTAETTASSPLPPVVSPPPPRTFNIEFKARHNSAMDRHTTLRQVSTAVQQLDPLSRNIVDYEEPQFTIAVEVLCKTVCVALLKDYKGNKKYNLQMLGGGGDVKVNGSGVGNVEEASVDTPENEVSEKEAVLTVKGDEPKLESDASGGCEDESDGRRDDFGFMEKQSPVTDASS